MLWQDPADHTPTPQVADAVAHPDTTAAALASREPDAGQLSALNPRRLSDTGLIDALIASEKLLATVAAKQQEFLAELAHRDPHGDRYLRDEAACALKVAPGTAVQKLDEALELTGRLFDTNELVAAGHLSPMNARILARAVPGLTDDVTAKVQNRVLPRGCAQTPGEFRAAVRRAVAKFDRKDETAKHTEAFAQRHVTNYPTENYMADVVLHLAADGATIVTTAINAWAAKTGTDDKRTADQRRADAIVDICSHALALPGLPKEHGIKPSINVTIAESTLRGEDDQPANLDGYGPIPASMALPRRLRLHWRGDPHCLADLPGAHQHRFLVDADGRILDRDATLTSDQYEPPPRIARHVINRDQHCIHPGCRRKAGTCQLDHRIPWPDGPTSAENLEPLCKRHHDLKHHSNWRLHKCPDGSYEWTSPTRHTYRYRPPELPTPTREAAPERPQQDHDDEPPRFLPSRQ